MGGLRIQLMGVRHHFDVLLVLRGAVYLLAVPTSTAVMFPRFAKTAWNSSQVAMILLRLSDLWTYSGQITLLLLKEVLMKSSKTTTQHGISISRRSFLNIVPSSWARNV